MNEKIKLKNRIPKTISIRKDSRSKNKWKIKQNKTGPYGHAQPAIFIEIENSNKTQKEITIDLSWLEYSHIEYKKCAYIKHKNKWTVVRGEISPAKTSFTFKVPVGTSEFHALPWYTIEDSLKFIEKVTSGNSFASCKSIGKTKEERDINVLVLKKNPKAKKTFFINAREHATETAGSFSIEAIVDYLLKTKTGGKLLNDFVFEIMIISSPDAVAAGRPYPQKASLEVSDIHYKGFTSKDPTCKAIREYLFSLKPDCMVNYHGFLMSIPEIIAYDKDDGLVMTEYLMDRKKENQAPTIYLKYQAAEKPYRTMLYYCVKNFGTTLGLFEVPWGGFPFESVKQTGLAMFLSLVKAYYKKNRKRITIEPKVYNSHVW
ncbi:MAG: M14 family zinc carboxypeptidase [Planctomycetota bacterium]